MWLYSDNVAASVPDIPQALYQCMQSPFHTTTVFPEFLFFHSCRVYTGIMTVPQGMQPPSSQQPVLPFPPPML